MTWKSTEITRAHDLGVFDCGNPDLNLWLRNSALEANSKGTSRTYVWTAGDDPIVRAYYAIAPTAVISDRDGLSKSMSTGLSAVPGFLLAKFALDQTLHGKGLGEQLLVDAVTRIMGASQASGGRLIVADAIDESAHGFYTRYGFNPVQQTKRRLVMKLSTAFKAFGVG